MNVRVCPPPTERLRFREYQLDDVRAVAAMFDDPEARQWYPTHSEPDQARRWIDWNNENYATHGFGLWAIEERSSGAFLGDCGLTYQTVEGEQLLELGYHLQQLRRGFGYATEAAQACLAYAFEDLDADLVCSIVNPGNVASIAVAGSIHELQRQFVNDAGTTMNLYWTDRS
ncbi:MAG: GNAT family N-acetyltransferase [Actinomycetia bacterium]|nr:GNAT family N-acetyltransferase [Actinomycetes bacterium]